MSNKNFSYYLINDIIRTILFVFTGYACILARKSINERVMANKLIIILIVIIITSILDVVYEKSLSKKCKKEKNNVFVYRFISIIVSLVIGLSLIMFIEYFDI